MPHDWQPTNAHDDRAQVTKAREAAEALFRPNKVERTEAPTSASVAALLTEHPAPRGLWCKRRDPIDYAGG